MATTTTCLHGVDANTCLICETLNPKSKNAPIPAGRAEVVTKAARPERKGFHVGVVGALLLVVGAVFVGWGLIHVVWSLFHLFELVVVGVLCAFGGYKVGHWVGRHGANQPRH